MTDIRDRIIDFRRVKASELIPSENNWRVHPESQKAALAGLLSEIGYVDALMCRQENGHFRIIDGHLRAETTPDMEVPIIVVDLTDEEADKVLATFDPLATLAESDAAKLEALLAEIQTEDDAVREMLDGLAEDAGILADADEQAEESPYTNKIIAPVYEPKGERPPLSALIDRDKTQELIEGIDAAELPDDVKEFLRLAAERHTVFNFRQIAEYYCHADATLQDLMERSGLVIIDFDKAIEYGFVHLTERLGALADLEEADGDA